MNQNDIQKELQDINKALVDIDRGLDGWDKFLTTSALSDESVQQLKTQFDLLDKIETVRTHLESLKKTISDPTMAATLDASFLRATQRQIDEKTAETNKKYYRAFTIIQKVVDKKDTFPRDLNNTGYELMRWVRTAVKSDTGVQFSLYKYAEPVPGRNILWSFCIEFLQGSKKYFVQLLGKSDTDYGIWLEPWRFDINRVWVPRFSRAYNSAKPFSGTDQLMQEIRFFDKKGGYFFITDEDMQVDTNELRKASLNGIKWNIESWNTLSKGNRIVFQVKISPMSSPDGKHLRQDVLIALFLIAKRAWHLEKLPPAEQSDRIVQSYSINNGVFVVTHDLLNRQDKSKYHPPFWSENVKDEQEFMKTMDKREVDDFLFHLKQYVGL